MKTTSSSPFQRAAEVLDPPRNPGSTTAWWRWWWRTPAGLRLSVCGRGGGGGEARVWGERGVRPAYGYWGGRPPPLAPHYIGGSPKPCLPSLRIRSQHQTYLWWETYLRGESYSRWDSHLSMR